MSIIDGSAASVWGLGINTEPTVNPFLDYASMAMPTNMSAALNWVEFIFMSNGLYREASRRLVSYFVTDVELKDQPEEVKELWRRFLNETIDFRNLFGIVGLDLACYGNSFVSLIPAYRRNLMCAKCRQMVIPLREVRNNKSVFNFEWLDYEFVMTCPKCQQRGPAEVIDQAMGTHDGFRVKRWSPHDIEILHDLWTDSCTYVWKIPAEYRSQIQSGAPASVLENAPLEVIQAVKHNNWLEFDPGFIYHMREDALAGFNNRGWGISKVLANFRQAWNLQVLHRYNEAIGLDYIIPFRVITPETAMNESSGNFLSNMNAGNSMATIHSMIRKRRLNPTAWFSLPFPVKYQALGGDARTLVPSDLITQSTEMLLNNVGIPAEVFRGSLTLQSAPVALRLLEASNAGIPHSYNGLLRFLINKASTMLRWPSISARMKSVQHADNIERQMARLNLMTQGLVSPTRGLQSVDIDFREEVRQQMEDQEYQAKMQAELEERMQRSTDMQSMANTPPGGGGQPGAPVPGAPGAPAAPAPGGQPGAPPQAGGGGIVAGLPQGPNQSISPEEMQQRADYLIRQLYGPQVTEGQRQSELTQLKKTDPNLHAVVKSRMQDINQKAKTQGKDIVLAQQFGKTGAALKAKLRAARLSLPPE